MLAILLPNSGLRHLSPVISPANIHFQKKNFSHQFHPPKREIQWPNSSIIRSEGSKSTGGNDELNKRFKASGNEEILALFRRIKSSIAKGGQSKILKRRGHGVPESVSQVKNRSIGQQKGSERTDDGSLLEESRFSKRGLSKSVRRSENIVASPLEEQGSMYREDGVEKRMEGEGKWEKGGGSMVLEMQKIDGMKLRELKEFARREGIKGFSKMKKGELLQILKERFQAS